MVLTFPNVDSPLQNGVAMGVVFDSWHGHVLRKVDRLIGVVRRHDAEDHGQQVLRARQLLKRNGNVISGMKLQIEAQRSLGGRYRAWKVFARLLRFQNRGIRAEEPD